jgi:ABC-type transporter Mla subunit MlaD
MEGDLSLAQKLMGHLDEVNYRELATNADTLMTQLRGDLREMHLAKVSNDADEVLTGVKGTIRQLNVFMANLDTASLNDSLANLRLASRDLDDTLLKLQRYPAGFLLGRPPPPARGVEKDKE